MTGVPCAMPPISVQLTELILVHCQRGEGALLRSVTQVYTKAGDLVAEHDEIHPDPIWPACYLRNQIAAGCAQAWEG